VADLADLGDLYRAEATRRLGNASTAEQELLALALFERDLSRLSATNVEPTPLDRADRSAAPPDRALSIPIPPPERLADVSAYTANLALILSGAIGHQLTPIILEALNQFNLGKLLDPNTARPRMGNPENAAFIAGQLNQVSLPNGVVVLGSWNEAEAGTVHSALATMHARLPASRDLIDRVVLRTFIEGGHHSQTAGLYTASRPGEVQLGRWLAPEEQARVLYHETAHELDRRHDNISSAPGSPFGQTANPLDYVSEYATTSPTEDFAETHADLVVNWELFMQTPDVYLHGEGGQAEKRRFILERCYGVSVSPPSERWQQLTEDACAPGSPFYQSGNGAMDEFRHAVARLNRTDPLAPVTDPGLQWLLAHAAPANGQEDP